MMDIVERCLNARYEINGKVCADAANEIESLRAQLAECQRERDDFDKRLSKELTFGLTAQGQITQLTQQLEATKVDAERYRWLRQGESYSVRCQTKGSKPVTYFVSDRYEGVDYGEALDQAIDAARGKEQTC